MFRRSMIAAASLAVAAGCATQQGATQGNGEGQQAQESRQRITNQGYFDVATCFPRTRDLSGQVNEEMLIGLLVSARPEVIECLVDPAHRGTTAETTLFVKATVDTTGVTYTATGDNLTEAGQKCIQSKLEPMAEIQPRPEGAEPVTAQIEVHHTTGKVLPGVVMGVNDASDIVGKIRLATPTWCDCFEPWKSSPPEELTAQITVTKENPKFQAEFTPPTTESGKQVMACLEPKVEALEHTVTADTVQVPKYPFIFLHSGLAETPVNAEPLVQFLQLDSARAQAQAQVAIAVGQRTNRVTDYDSLVKEYQKIQKDWRKADKMVPKLVTECKALVAADQAWADTVKQQLAVEEATLAKAKEFSAQDPQWATAAAETEKQLVETQKQLAQAEEVTKADAAICPKPRK